MTKIILTVSGAKARAAVSGPLTSGMVGIPVTVEYDEAWDGLTKNLVCRCGRFSSDRGLTRTVPGIEETATVAHEVMQGDMYLYLGVEGYSEDGKLVIPTTWADCGKIQYGANAGADPSTDPRLPVWAQLQAQISQMGQGSITQAQIAALDGMFQVALYDNTKDYAGAYAAFQAAFGISGSGDSGETEVTLTKISVVYSGGDVPVGTDVSELTGVVVTAHYSDGSTAVVTGYEMSGTIEEGSNTIIVTYQRKLVSFTVIGVAEPTGDETEVTLSKISVVYSGGDVPVGTDVSELTGVVVTAHYSDGSTAVVTGYEMSGTIEEGSNTIIVTYQQKLVSFSVTGVAVTTTPLGVDWTEGIIVNKGTESSNDTWISSDFISVADHAEIRIYNDSGKLFNFYVNYYDADKGYMSCLTNQFVQGSATYPSPLALTVPDGCAYARLSTSIQSGSATAGYVRYDELTYELA